MWYFVYIVKCRRLRDVGRRFGQKNMHFSQVVRRVQRTITLLDKFLCSRLSLFYVRTVENYLICCIITTIACKYKRKEDIHTCVRVRVYNYAFECVCTRVLNKKK